MRAHELCIHVIRPVGEDAVDSAFAIPGPEALFLSRVSEEPAQADVGEKGFDADEDGEQCRDVYQRAVPDASRSEGHCVCPELAPDGQVGGDGDECGGEAWNGPHESYPGGYPGGCDEQGCQRQKEGEGDVRVGLGTAHCQHVQGAQEDGGS